MQTYDQQAFLPAAVGSLLDQTYAHWECVIVDDGSPGDPRAPLDLCSTTDASNSSIYLATVDLVLLSTSDSGKPAGVTLRTCLRTTCGTASISPRLPLLLRESPLP